MEVVGNYLADKARNSTKFYFMGQVVGYLIAIIVTVIIMIMFDHGQPALLYLVPGCIISVLIPSLIKGEFGKVRDWNEEELYEPEGDKEE